VDPSTSEPGEPRSADGAADEHEALDLDAVADDLAAVEVAMDRIQAGTYWTDEVTGEPLPDAVLAANPIARRDEPAARTVEPTTPAVEPAEPAEPDPPLQPPAP